MIDKPQAANDIIPTSEMMFAGNQFVRERKETRPCLWCDCQIEVKDDRFRRATPADKGE